MNFNEYQKKAKKYDCFEADSDPKNPAFVAKLLGLTEEAGEVAGKFKKILRDDNGVISEEKENDVKKELGDVLWYLATISRYMGIDFDDVAKMNLDKLEDRHRRNKLHGSGDNR